MICIVDCGTSFLKDIESGVAAAGHGRTVVPMDKIADRNLARYSGIIISGAPILLTEADQDAFIARFGFVADADVPILGICFGHQVIGLVYGAAVSRGEKIQKEEAIRMLCRDPLFAGIEDGVFHEEHSESIILPEGFVSLADSATCRNEAMKHRERTLYGTQFHPERSGESGRRLLANFLSMCGKE